MNKMKSVKPNPNSTYNQGYFIPKNPEKYVSADKTIIYRSSLEFEFCKLCDQSSKITKWASEPIKIQYEHPFDKNQFGIKKTMNYYPDYFVEIVINGIAKKYVIEIKPMSFIIKPKPLATNANMKQKSNYLYKIKTISVNQAKAKAAQRYCKAKGWEYMFITEEFIKKLKK